MTSGSEKRLGYEKRRAVKKKWKKYRKKSVEGKNEENKKKEMWIEKRQIKKKKERKNRKENEREREWGFKKQQGSSVSIMKGKENNWKNLRFKREKSIR